MNEHKEQTKNTVGKLTVTVRSMGGKGLVRALRTKGQVPGVCYGASPDGRVDPLPITVDLKALRAALDPVRKQNTVIDLTIEGDSRKLHALIKDYQVEAVRRDITHVDILVIDPNKEVSADVPIEFLGKPKGTVEGGQLRTVIRFLQVRAKPSDIPIKLSVDVSPLEIGDVIHVHEIALPPNVTVVTNRDLAVVTCAAPEAEEVVAAPTDAAAVPGAEGAAGAAPGAGAAPAAGGKPGDAKAAAPAAGGKADPKAAGGKAAPAAPAPAKKK